MRLGIGATVIAGSLAVGGLAHAGYEMADLKALEKQGAWQELFDHLGDIPPSKRNKDWEQLAEKSATGVLDQLKLDENGFERPVQTMDDLPNRFPTLKGSKAYQAKRAEVGLKAFQKSYSRYRHSSGDDPWIDGLKKFVDADTLTTDLPMRAGKLIMGRLIAEVAFPFYKRAVERQGPSVCKDADAQKSIIEAFADGVWLKELGELVQNRCFAELKEPLVKALGGPKVDEKYVKNVCPVLKAKAVTPPACTKPPEE